MADACRLVLRRSDLIQLSITNQFAVELSGGMSEMRHTVESETQASPNAVSTPVGGSRAATFGSHIVRGGRMTKWKGKAASLRRMSPNWSPLRRASAAGGAARRPCRRPGGCTDALLGRRNRQWRQPGSECQWRYGHMEQHANELGYGSDGRRRLRVG